MQDNRRHFRVQVQISASCEREGAAPCIVDLLDLSLGGVFVGGTANIPNFGECVVLCCDWPGEPNKVRLPGVVRWVKPGGFGVQFGLLGAKEAHIVTRTVRDSINPPAADR